MKFFQRLFSILLIAGLMLGFTSSGAMLASSALPEKLPADPAQKFEPLALNQLSSGKADFFVTMAEQADLSAADRLQSKEARGAYVFQALSETAFRTQAGLKAYLDQQSVKYTSFYIVNTLMIKGGTRDLAMAIAARPDVSLISSNHSYQLDKPMIDQNAANQPAGIEPNISYVKADQVWALGITGEGTIVAGNDTGLDETHPAIKARYRGCVNPPTCSTYDNNYNWWDATGTYPNDPWDGFGHGTHTTGTMMGDDGLGNQVGMAPGAQTIHCKNMTDSGSGDDNTFLTCFQWDLAPWDLNHQNPRPDLAPDVINNSWGYWGGGANQFRTAINNLQSAGILVEVSAGNEGSGCSSLRSPGDYWEVLTTGSVNHVPPFPGTITGFSSRGPSSLDPGYYFPDIMAPGENIRSSVPGGGYEGGWSGTSMAGPHATGLIGLMWSAAPGLRGQVAETIEIIHQTAVPLTGQNGSNCGGDYTVGPNNDWGFGTIDALAAVQEAMSRYGGGSLDGTVTSVSTGDPIEGVKVTAVRTDGYSKTKYTDITGYYTATIAAGTYDVTASKYGYIASIVDDVVVVTDTHTTQDFQLFTAPIYTVSGHVYDSISGDPLQGTVKFTDAPVPSVDTDPNGYYSLSVAQGTWNMLATALSHTQQGQQVVVNGDIVVDFLLDPLPCILLVDDDNNAPNITPYYTAALDAMGLDYDIFDTAGGAGPNLAGLQGYRMVFWYSGDAFGNTAGPGSADETNLTAYLDAGGKLFLDSQDYLYDFGLTSFGQNYLGVGSFTSDTGDATSIVGLAGDPIGDGLGPYTLSYPADFSDYGDIISSGSGGSISFKAVNNNNLLNVDKDGGDWRSVFFATSWVPVYNNNAANGRAVLQRVADFFGGCAAIPDEPIAGLTASNDSPTVVGTPTSFTASVTGGTNVHFDWDFGDGSVGSGSVVEHIYAEPGSYVATVHAWNDVSEATTTTTATIVDISLAPGAQEKLGEPGTQVTYVFTVTNEAPVPQEVLLSVDALWPTSAPSTTGELGAGESLPVPVVVTIPTIPNAIIGQDTFTLHAAGVIGGERTASGTTFANVTPGGEVTAPQGKTGKPLEVVSYEFEVTNTGNYTDSFAIGISGVWEVVLPGGDNTGPLAPGASTTVTVLVTVPQGASNGDTDVTTFKITSQLDTSVWTYKDVTTTAQRFFFNLLSLVLR